MRRRFRAMVAAMGGGVAGYSISGNAGVAGATITFGAYSAVSGADGTYTITGIAANSTGYLRASKTGYVFTPNSIFLDMTGNVSSQDFTAEAFVATYYVRKTGNDTTGDGSTENPWLTLTKALATVPIGGGSGIYIGDGTYQEDVAGYFFINRSFTDWVTFLAEGGAAGNVIIQGASSASFDTRFYDSGKIRFNDVTFNCRVGNTDRSVVSISDRDVNDNLEFNNCTFTVTSVTGQNSYCVRALLATNTITGLAFNNCTFNQTGAFPGYGIGGSKINNIAISGCNFAMVSAGISLNTCDVVTLTDNTASGGISGALLPGVTNLTATGGSYSGTGIAFLLGVDGTSGAPCSGTISGITAVSTASHALGVAAGCSGATVTGCNVTGGDQGLIVKENTGSIITNNTIVSGTVNGLYFKAATDPVASGNSISGSAGYLVKVEQGDTGNKSSGVSFQNNEIYGTGTAGLLFWSEAGDSGGSICDYNTYSPEGSAKFGAVRADADVQTLAELLAAWSTYDVPTNDANSVVV